MKRTQFHPFTIASPAEVDYMRKHIQCRLCEDTRGIVAYRKGRIGGLYVFDNWSESAVQVHQAVTDRAVLRDGFHREAFEYLFGACQRSKLIGMTPADNAKAIRLNAHYGFVVEARIKDGYDVGIDFVVMTMTPDQCRYYEEKGHGKRAA